MTPMLTLSIFTLLNDHTVDSIGPTKMRPGTENSARDLESPLEPYIALCM
jgi:hypothetical protein